MYNNNLFNLNIGGLDNMQNSFPYFDIIIFGIIAIFLVYRLKNVLGTKTDFDESNIKEQDRQKKSSKIIQLRNEKNIINSKDKNIDYVKIQETDPSFNMEDFLSGSRKFFQMVLEGFSKGNLENIKDFIKPSVLKSFNSAIHDREKDNETLMLDLKSISKNEILSHKITKNTIKISVLFETYQIKALLDKNDEIIDGNINEEILVKDVWTFEKNINFNTPNWTLVETKSS